MKLRELIRDGLACYVAHPELCTSHAIWWTGYKLMWFGKTPGRRDTERRMICQSVHLFSNEWVLADGLELPSNLKHQLAMRIGKEHLEMNAYISKTYGRLDEIVAPLMNRYVSHPHHPGLYRWNGHTLLDSENRLCSVLPHMILDNTWTTP